ncbi:MAG: HNH endonuclease, partial [candidate division NC10 bacterium]
MPFSEATKLQVKHKAAFRCCRCQAIGIEIHHILSDAQGGPSSIDNAAPLCAKCHTDFGDNPQKRKEIREMRDWWYQQVEMRASRDLDPRLERMEETLNDLLLHVSENRATVDQIKNLLHARLGVSI